MVDRPTDNATTRKRLMKGFWPLFQNKARVFAAPAIAFFVFVHLVFDFGPILLFTWFPDLYRAIVLHLTFPSLMNTLVWHPIFGNDALTFMYTTLFIFMLIQEHRKQLQTQLHMLPVRRMTLLFAIFAAFAFWLLIFEASLPTIQQTLALMHVINRPVVNIPYSAFLIMRSEGILTILTVAAIGMLGFVVATVMPDRWWRYLAGMAAGLAGYMAMSWYVSYFRQHGALSLPMMRLPGPHLLVMNPGYSVLPYALILPVFIIASLLIYERFSEV